MARNYISVLNNTDDGSPKKRAAVGIVYLAVAQLVEHGIVVVNNIPVVPGSNPGGEISAPTAIKK